MQQPENLTSNNKLSGVEKTIYIGSDHAGYKLKGYIKTYLSKKGYNPVDMGNEDR